MAALMWIAAKLRAVTASHVTLQLMYRCRFRSTHDVEGNGLMRLATQATNF
jgi:hypothetical protein